MPLALFSEVEEESVKVRCLHCETEINASSLDSATLYDKDRRFCTKHCHKKYKRKQKKTRGESLTSVSGLEEEEAEVADEGMSPAKVAKKDVLPVERPASRLEATPSRMEATPSVPLRFPSARDGGESNGIGTEEISPRLPSPDKHPRDWTVSKFPLLIFFSRAMLQPNVGS